VNVGARLLVDPDAKGILGMLRLEVLSGLSG
jgi:hypothetical protein